MKVYHALAVFTVLLCVLAPNARAQSVHTPDGKTCLIASEKDFRASVTGRKPPIIIRTADGVTLSKILVALNRPRAVAGLYSFEADKLIIGLIKNEKGEVYVGFALFMNGCLLPGGVGTMSLPAWVAFATSAGVSIDDFSEEREAGV